MARSKTLPVPYFTQTTDTNCQGTVLKMMASFLDAKLNISGSGGKHATDIKTSINSGAGRPSQLHNAHANMRWWLEQNYPQFTFEYSNTSFLPNSLNRHRKGDVAFGTYYTLAPSGRK